MRASGTEIAQSAESLLLEFEQSGDAAPFQEIVRRYSGMVYGVCYRVTRNSHDAEDAAQAVFLKLAVQARTANRIPRIGPWLQQVAKTTAVDLRRSRTRRQSREQVRAAITAQQGEASDATCDAGVDELKQLLRDEVDRLPPHYRTPLVLYYFGGLSTEQIACELNSNAKALAVRLFRGRKMLGSRLQARGITTAGGAVVTLAVADVILSTLARSLCGPRIVAGCASTSWLSAHSAVCSSISTRVLSITRTCAMGGLAGKWKLSVIVLLTVGSALAGSSDAVRASAALHTLSGLIDNVGTVLRSLSRARRLFQGSTPQLQAQGQPQPAATAEPAPAAIHPFPPPAVAWTPEPYETQRVVGATPNPAPRIWGAAANAFSSQNLAGGPVAPPSRAIAAAQSGPLDNRVSVSATHTLLAMGQAWASAGGSTDQHSPHKGELPPAALPSVLLASIATSAPAGDLFAGEWTGAPTGPFRAAAAAPITPPATTGATTVVATAATTDLGSSLPAAGVSFSATSGLPADASAESAGLPARGFIFTNPDNGSLGGGAAASPLQPGPIPEPSGLLLLGMAGLGLLRRRRMRSPATADRQPA